MERVWIPSPARIEAAAITDFARTVARTPATDFQALWRWSIDHKETFWRGLWDYTGVIGDPGARTLIDGDRMPGARWFPDASLNFAQNLLEHHPAAATTDDHSPSRSPIADCVILRVCTILSDSFHTSLRSS